MKKTLYTFLILTLSTILLSCQKSDEKDKEAGKIKLQFEYFVNGDKLFFDEMNYTNTAGNKYEIAEVQWFISDLILNKTDGSNIALGGEKFAHYIDTNLPETLSWNLPDDVPTGEYQSLSMTFGIKGEKNKPFIFTDPPESDMLWPINLGGDQGGYHYMKMNGFWINEDDQRTPFNFHLGVGQERDADDKIIGFIQNWFEVELPASSFSIGAEEQKFINIRMNIENWWDTPNIYNHDVQGGKIMQNQDAMRMGVENGRNVFSIGGIGKVEETM